MNIPLTEHAWKKLGYKLKPDARFSHVKQIRSDYHHEGGYYMRSTWRKFYPRSEVSATDKAQPFPVEEKALAKYRSQLENAVNLSNEHETMDVEWLEISDALAQQEEEVRKEEEDN